MDTIDIIAETFMESNPETFSAPCPACGAPVRYVVARRAVRCPECGWDAPLSEDESRDFLWAAIGCNDLDMGAFLAAIANRPVLSPPRALASGKQQIPASKGETPWQTLMRLGAQALVLNSVRVTPFGASGRLYKVTSQVPAAGRREEYLVSVGELTTCTCRYGQAHPGEPCSHIGAAYLYLTGDPPAAVPAPVDRQARAAAAYDDLYGAA